MIKIYHNPRCRKSREGLQILKDYKKEFEIIKYLENIPTEGDLCNILYLLNIAPIELVRKKEQIWKDNYKGKRLSGKDIIKAMAKHPKLIERPIVVNGKKAIIGRPAELIIAIL